jgi:hypothetical protein
LLSSLGGQFSPTDGSCACHLEVNLNPIWSYWPRNFQPMYLIDRSSAFQRVLGPRDQPARLTKEVMSPRGVGSAVSSSEPGECPICPDGARVAGRGIERGQLGGHSPL